MPDFKKKSGGLNYGKSTGLFTRGGFPDHSDVEPGPLNNNTTISISGANNPSYVWGSEQKPPEKPKSIKDKEGKGIDISQHYKQSKEKPAEERRRELLKDDPGQVTPTEKLKGKTKVKDQQKPNKEKKDPKDYESDKKTRFGRWADKLHQWRNDEESSHGDFQKVIDNAQQFVQTMSGGKVKAPKSFEQKQMERKSFAEDLKRKQLLNEQRNIHLAKMKENTTNTFDPFAVNNSGDPNNESSSVVASNANEIDMNEEQKKMYNERGDQYKDYSEKEYMDESKRQQDIYDQTGRWDYKNAPK